MSIYVTEKENLIAISPVYIQSKYGTLEKSKLFIEKKEMNVESVLYWRKSPKLYCNFSSIKKITKIADMNASLGSQSTRFGSRSESFHQNQIKNYQAGSTDFFDDMKVKKDSDSEQKLCLHFNNDVKVILDFSFTKPRVKKSASIEDLTFSRPNSARPTSFYFSNRNSQRSTNSGPREADLKAEQSITPTESKSPVDENGMMEGGSDTTSDSEGDQGQNDVVPVKHQTNYFVETSFEELEREIGDLEDEDGEEQDPEVAKANSNKRSAKTNRSNSGDNEEDAFNHLIFTIDELNELFQNFHEKSIRINQLDLNMNNPTTQQQQKTFEILIKQEQLLELTNHFKTQEATIILNNFFNRFFFRLLSKAFFHWIQKIKEMHEEDMVHDRHRWRLHAAANQELDLQAWYHALFYQEVYRLRGHFWYKDAVLPSYKQSYDLVDNALTPLEEAALAHVLCSPDTSYGDVAGQMFIVQAILTPKLFTLFQQLASQGAQIVKYPRQGRPAKKLFRFSFVDGNIYLTWKGKFGNQGVGMYEVTGITTGLNTEVLKWSGQSNKANLYLSLLCADRSIDLLFDTEQERIDWQDLLTALMSKEHGVLQGVESMDPPKGSPDFDHLILFSSIGKPLKPNSSSKHP